MTIGTPHKLLIGLALFISTALLVPSINTHAVTDSDYCRTLITKIAVASGTNGSKLPAKPSPEQIEAVLRKVSAGEDIPLATLLTNVILETPETHRPTLLKNIAMEARVSPAQIQTHVISRELDALAPFFDKILPLKTTLAKLLADEQFNLKMFLMIRNFVLTKDWTVPTYNQRKAARLDNLLNHLISHPRFGLSFGALIRENGAVVEIDNNDTISQMSADHASDSRVRITLNPKTHNVVVTPETSLTETQEKALVRFFKDYDARVSVSFQMWVKNSAVRIVDTSFGASLSEPDAEPPDTDPPAAVPQEPIVVPPSREGLLKKGGDVPSPIDMLRDFYATYFYVERDEVLLELLRKASGFKNDPPAFLLKENWEPNQFRLDLLGLLMQRELLPNTSAAKLADAWVSKHNTARYNFLKMKQMRKLIEKAEFRRTAAGDVFYFDIIVDPSLDLILYAGTQPGLFTIKSKDDITFTVKITKEPYRYEIVSSSGNAIQNYPHEERLKDVLDGLLDPYQPPLPRTLKEFVRR